MIIKMEMLEDGTTTEAATPLLEETTEVAMLRLQASTELLLPSSASRKMSGRLDQETFVSFPASLPSSRRIPSLTLLQHAMTDVQSIGAYTSYDEARSESVSSKLCERLPSLSSSVSLLCFSRVWYDPSKRSLTGSMIA